MKRTLAVLLHRRGSFIKLGLSQTVIAKRELGKTEPTSSAKITLARFFEETTDYILGVEY